jgi:ABC-2 type transport system permease protein
MTLQQLIGKYYKWWYIVQYSFKLGIVYFWSDFFWYLSNAFNLLVILFVWQISNRQDSPSIISYLLAGSIFFTLCSTQSGWNYFQRIFDGKISSDLLKPTVVIWYFFAEALGYGIKMMLSTFISLIPIFLLYRQNIDLNGNYWAFALLPLAFLIRYFMSTVVGLTSFWIKNSYGVINFYETIVPILAGSLIPISLLNLDFIQFLPFAFLFYHPMQIYLGKYDTTQTIMVFLGGLSWCLILWILARMVFKAGLKKNEAVGL